MELDFSPKLRGYLKKIENETGHPIKFQESTELGIKSITAAYQYHPRYILITLNTEYPRSPEDMERSIAHEATHGYLIHKLGFCRSKYMQDSTEDYRKEVQLVFTMIEDIVVNKIIEENGFPPFGHEYLPMVQKEIEIAKKGEVAGESFYGKFTDDLRLEALLMISRYIIAWGFLKYYSLNPQQSEIINEFIKTFQKYYPDYYKFTAQIVQILEEKDIFNPTQECEVINEILKRFK
ncbi:MAG: hypothetical protein LLF83_00325, partial [Methanobacterium sp.]|nr:hypothetical protein [Methanobacterium sp.]